MEGSVSGAFSDRDTPVPIPNTAVKPICADGSRKARVGQCREHSSSKIEKRTKTTCIRLFFVVSGCVIGYAIMRKSNVFSMSRIVRRIIIASIFLSFNALFWIGAYYAFLKAPETCFDAKQNQNEQGVDCGGVCTNACIEVVVGRDLQLKEVAFVPGGENRYDVLGRIFNANNDIGASSFRYTFELRDGTGTVLGTRSGISYILPQETKSLIELNLESSMVPTQVTLLIADVAWERLSGYQEKPTVNIYQKRYGQVTTGFGYFEAYGLLSNESLYDFRSIIVKVIARDVLGKPLAFNMTEMRTVNAQESRDFKLVWPLPFSGLVDRVDMEIDADVYHSDNFVKQYFPGGSAR